MSGEQRPRQQGLEESASGLSSGFAGHCLTTLAQWPLRLSLAFIRRLGPPFCAQKHTLGRSDRYPFIVSHTAAAAAATNDDDMGFFLLISCQQLSHLEPILSAPHQPCCSLGTWHLGACFGCQKAALLLGGRLLDARKLSVGKIFVDGDGD